MDPCELLTAQEAADACKVSVRTLFRWLAEGKLPATRIGRITRIRRSDLEEFLEAHLSGLAKDIVGLGSSTDE